MGISIGEKYEKEKQNKNKEIRIALKNLVVLNNNYPEYRNFENFELKEEKALVG